MNAETQLRQFLKAFKDTETFKGALDILDEDTRKKVQGFSDGKSADDVTKKGFSLPPSPAAKHHFRLLDLFDSLFDKKDHDKPAHKAETPKGSADAPKIYENANDTKIMKVCISILMTFPSLSSIKLYLCYGSKVALLLPEAPCS